MSAPFIQNSFVLEDVFFEGPYTEESILATKNFQGREDDIYLSTYPRTGTTWTQNILVGMIFGLEELKNTGQVGMRYTFPYMESNFRDQRGGYEIANEITRSPRLMKSHLPCHLSPREIFTHKRKNIVVVRNPKDTALSCFKFYQTKPTLVGFKKTDNQNEFLEIFLNENVFYGSWWKWTKAWVDKCREYPDNNLMFHYDDLHKNFEGTVSKISAFLSLEPMTSEACAALKAATSVDSMKTRYEKDGLEKDMINKGQMNGWTSKFSKEMAEKYDAKTRQTFGEDKIVDKFI
ncbi:cytosolic sulfotransferase 3-like [Convolutriloba macropyga]|uniref:cytosolic sulfotransferase 3-like n=1 Tax=Convolutriloba macropyga TaxID=536237 RepID=UPI003F5207AD